MSSALHQGGNDRPWLSTMLAVVFVSLTPIPGSAESPAFAEKARAVITASLKGGGKGKQLAQMAEHVVRESKGLAELSTAQEEYIDSVTREWGKGGEERMKLQAASRALQQNMERTNSYLSTATEAAGAVATRVQQSGVLEKAAQVNAAAKESGERLSARWERERAAREREREQREREAGERARARP